MEVTFKVYNIDWDCDDATPEELGLPETMEVTIDLDADEIDYEEYISDVLADEITDITGFCHNGFNYTQK